MSSTPRDRSYATVLRFGTALAFCARNRALTLLTLSLEGLSLSIQTTYR